MKKVLSLFLLILTFKCNCYASEATFSPAQNKQIQVYSEKNKFGLEEKNGNKITPANYKKLIILGKNSYLCQKGNRFGIIDKEGKFLVPARFRHAERIFGQYAKLGNDGDYGLYNQFGEIIIKPEYSSIEPLFGKMYVTCKNYQYGIVSFDGQTILANRFDDIYMPNPSELRINYQGKWYELERVDKEAITLPVDLISSKNKQDEYTLTDLVENTGIISGYSVVSFTDYLLKIFSSISPAYEETIDELMFSQGAESVNIIIKASWLPRFPFTYAKMYYRNLKAPNSGPLSNIRTDLKRQIK
ncbi:MAG: WG repeat-containing protein [Candidatus Gastranaerophilales bacterium]|nr:WG repeat-containing protein [Candidatus Gastranaerophilales bacterium]